MDEPLSNLDALLRLQTRKELIELTGELKSTVIYVTHDQVEAMTMGHRLAVMNKEKLSNWIPLRTFSVDLRVVLWLNSLAVPHEFFASGDR